MIMMKCSRCNDECEFDGNIQHMSEKDLIHYVIVDKCSECYDEINECDEIIKTEYLDKDGNILVVELDVPLDSIIETKEN